MQLAAVAWVASTVDNKVLELEESCPCRLQLGLLYAAQGPR